MESPSLAPLASAFLGMVALGCAAWDMVYVVVVRGGAAQYGSPATVHGLFFWLAPILLGVLVWMNIRQWRSSSSVHARHCVLVAVGTPSLVFVAAFPSLMRLGLSFCCCNDALCPDDPLHVPPFVLSTCDGVMEDCATGIYRQLLQTWSLWLTLICCVHTMLTQVPLAVASAPPLASLTPDSSLAIALCDVAPGSHHSNPCP
ncbi:Aste57867_15540 [Aphanomyces stellatus]|uniref:Aste57867_15540 protein n=1 Tax=Aphanomyces stellatus TaxID=120398 RepID=A0A485L3Y1_9STRA|nr:hypothetical protein As57867_015484 [Aphanomyces stellatus]VFT92342.1 Aste57867_15540 [Aphanomyces stellatus]